MSLKVIAEVGMMHEGSLGTAKCLVDAAKSCGADAVKFQTHIAEAETLPNAPMPGYFSSEPRYDYFKRTAFTKSQWQSLKEYCDSKKIQFLSSAFSSEAVELLDSIGMSMFKIPSGEITNIPYLQCVAKTGKPILLSSGMSSWAELDEAIEVILSINRNLTLLQCTSMYPCSPEAVGLNILGEMKTRYKLPVGFSDHTLTNYAAFAATVMGISVLEKHLVLSRLSYGSDAKHSLEPAEFREMCTGIRTIEAMLANPVDKNNLAPFKQMKNIFEKSVVAVQDINAGAIITASMLGIKKPGGGIPPKRFAEAIGKKTRKYIAANSVLQSDDIDWK